MADKKDARDDGPSYEPHPKGQFAARCCDIIDLGFKAESYQNNPVELKDKTALVFRTEATREDGKPWQIGQEFTHTMGKKGNMRKFLEAWRGEPYTEEQAKAGVPLDKLEGVPALITVAHKVSGAGNTYAIIAGIQPLPKKMLADAPNNEGYERAPFWAERKAEYAKGAAAHQQGKPKTGTSTTQPAPDGGDPFDDDDDEPLPF